MNSTNSPHRSTVRPLALALVLGLIGAAQASAAEPAGIKVHYGDLDLATNAGAHTLYVRISGAARTVCGFEGTALVEQSRRRSAVYDVLVNGTDVVIDVTTPSAN